MRLHFILSEIGIGLRRNLSMAISVALVTMVSVLFVGLGVLTQRQVDTMKEYWYDRVQVSIFLCTDKSNQPNCSAGAVTGPQRAAIRSQLVAMKPLVENVFLESQQEAYEHFKEQVKDSSSFRDVKPEAMPESFRVQLSDPTKYAVISSSFVGAPGVGDVQDQRRILDPLFNVLRGLSLGAWALAVMMALCSLLLVGTTIRQLAYGRRRETGIMRLVGASAFIIQLPFILETLVATMVGSVLATGGLRGLVNYGVGYLDKTLAFKFITVSDVYVVMPLVVAGTALLTTVTAWFTLRRYLRV